MDYWPSQIGSPIYEFPYSGGQTQSLPFSNYNSNPLGPNVNPSFDSSFHNQPSPFTSYNAPQTPSTLNNNVRVFHVPDNIPLEVILRELGVDVNSLQRTSSHNDYNRSRSPTSERFYPQSSPRRRRLVFEEVSDDDSDDYRRQSPRYRRNSGFSQSPANLQNSLGNAWNNPQSTSGNLPRSNTAPNMNSQWPGMQNTPGSMPPNSPNSPNVVANVWNRASNASNKITNRFPNLFSRPGPGSGVVIQPPFQGVQQNRQAVQDFNAARNLPAGLNQPNSSAVNVWNRAANATRSGPPGASNLPWNRMASSSPPPPMNSAAVNVWNRAANAPQYGPPPPSNIPWNRMSSPPPPMNPAWNQMSRASSPPPPMSSAAVNVWNRAANAPQYGPPPPSNIPWNRMSSPPPPMNPAWNQMSRASSPPPPMSSAAVNVWNRTANAPQYGPPAASNIPWNQMPRGSPPPQQFNYPPGPPVNSMWNQMR